MPDQGDAGRDTAGMRFHYEMGCTESEFFRLLPAAVGGADMRIDGSTAVHEEAERGWRIRLSNRRQHALARLRLPVVDVDLEFHGYSAAEVDRFMERFHAAFRRGGG